MSTTEVAIQSNPFPGLRPFKEEEDYLFFGRDSQVDAMVNKLAANRFLAVVGTSGSGKSSLVNCGLRPALHSGFMAGAGTRWRMAQFRPGSDPLGAMARELARDDLLFRDYQPEGLTLSDIVDTTLRMSKLGLVDIYEQAQLGEDVNLLVVVDQFEELFRYRHLGADQQENSYDVSDEAVAFVNLLLEAARQTTHPIYVVLTMRSDFLGDCAQFSGLPEAINAGQYLVPRMTRDERRQAISGPVGVGGAEISPVLLTRLVNDVGDNPDQLSILQHALNRTWDRWQKDEGANGPLELSHYKSIGEMSHALDQHAEQVYAELGASEQRQQICEKIFKALTDKATDPRGVRRPTRLDALCAVANASEAEVTEVIDVFRQPSRSFLFMNQESDVDISHESLMRVWVRLKNWTDEEAESARSYQRLLDRARAWRKGEAELLGNRDLENALAWREQEQPTATWAERYGGGFELAMRFLDESVVAKEAREKEERLRQKRVQQLLISVIVVIAIAAVVSTWAWRKSAAAAEQSDAILTVYQETGKTLGESSDLGVFAKIDRLNKALGDFETFVEERDNQRDLRELLAATYYNTASWAESQIGVDVIPFYEKARDIRRDLANANQNDPALKEDLADTINKIGGVYLDNKKWDEAYDAINEAATLRQKIVSADPENLQFNNVLASSYMNLGILARRRGNYDDALKNYAKADEIWEKSLKESDDPRLLVDYANGQLNIVSVLQTIFKGEKDKDLKHLEEAKMHIDKAESAIKTLLANNATSPDYQHIEVKFHQRLGEIQGLTGVYEEAILHNLEAAEAKYASAVAEFTRAAEKVNRIVHEYPTIAAYARTHSDIDKALDDHNKKLARIQSQK